MATNAEQFAELTNKRNNILVDNDIILPYNSAVAYSSVTTSDGCEIHYPLFDADDEAMVNIQKKQMSGFVDMQSAEQEAMAIDDSVDE